ncbi:hypothetical protein OBDJBBDK_00246 [Aeromonas phage AhFM11]|nr:hypothetical protein OBDJBBDK_00246 [Aeromonas phage AhFM11]
MRKAIEMTNSEKVRAHFMFRELKMGYVQIGCALDVKATEIPDVIAEVDGARIDFLEREPVVYRKHYVNPNRHKTKIRKTKVMSHKVAPTAESLSALMDKFAK